MKINVDNIKMMPLHIGNNFCVYGPISDEINEWCKFHGISIQPSGKFTNLILPKDISAEDLFIHPSKYEYLDGFSPNLNKHLHLGHLSNLVLAKSFQSLGIAEKSIAILGDTLVGEVTKEEALSKFHYYCSLYKYKVDNIFLASEMKLSDNNILVDGEGDYSGTKVFKSGDNTIVGIKTNGSTSYFYQDIALAQKLNASTLYLTGSEQKEHFDLIKNIFPHIDHIPLGLVLLNGEKISSRTGNVIYASEVFDLFNDMFKDDQISYNVLAGQILKSDPKSSKNINMDMVGNVKTSMGLYISYTTARLKSAGIEPLCSDKFISNNLSYSYVKALVDNSPHYLFNSLIDHCKVINNLYSNKDYKIVGNESNKSMFTKLMMDLELGLKKLGLFSIEKINHN